MTRENGERTWPHSKRSTCLGQRRAAVYLLPRQKQNGGQHMTIQYDPTFPPLRKGRRCQAPALCSSQWRRCVYGTFHLCDKENHHSSWNGGTGVFRASRWGGWWNQQRTKEFRLLQLWKFRWWCGRSKEKRKFWGFYHLTFLNWGERTCLRQKVTVVTRKMVEKLRILRKNIFGKSLTKYAPSGVQNTIRNRKSRYRFFKYGSLWLRCPETLFISHENANFLFSVLRVDPGEAKTPLSWKMSTRRSVQNARLPGSLFFYQQYKACFFFACFSTMPSEYCKKKTLDLKCRTVQKIPFGPYDWKPIWPEHFSFSVPFSIITHEHPKKSFFKKLWV